MENKKSIKEEPLNFFSNDMTVAKDQLAHNHLKLTYQRDSVTDLQWYLFPINIFEFSNFL